MLPTKRIRMLFSNYIVLRVFLINNTVLFDDKMVYLAKMNLGRSFVMRKALICASVLSMLISSKAIASEIDLSGMSLDELVTLKNSVMEEIDSRIGDSGDTIGAGVYVVGEDIKEGSYLITVDNNESIGAWVFENEETYDEYYKVWFHNRSSSERIEMPEHAYPLMGSGEVQAGKSVHVKLEESNVLWIVGGNGTISVNNASWVPEK